MKKRNRQRLYEAGRIEARARDKREERDETQLTKIPFFDKDKFDRNYKNKIDFYSHGLFLFKDQIGPDTVEREFRVYTKRRIPKKELYYIIEKQFPRGCNVKPVWGYKYRNTFDVRTTTPITWKEFQHRVVTALERYL